MNLKRLFITIVFFIFSMQSNAELVKIKFKNLTVNANLIHAEDKSQPFFLILHGTWAWHGMELIESTQILLEDEDVGSLALTLSLGVDNRSGFLGCPSPLEAIHQQSYEEVHLWYQYLYKLGYKNIILLSHSRGGSQAAAFASSYPDDKLSKIVLLAPLAWDKATVHKDYQKKTGKNLQQLLDQANRACLKKIAPLMKSVDVLYCKNQDVKPWSFLSYYSDDIERNTWDLIKNQTIPIDIFLGSEDPISTLFSDSIKGKKLPQNINLITIEGSDHFFRDLYLDEIIESVVDFD